MVIPGKTSETKGTTAKPRRVALYSHDTMGIGHVRRNLLIAQALAESPHPTSILLIAGAREAGAFAVPKGVDCLTLPSFRKDDLGQYESRSLNVSLRDLVTLRSQSIKAAIEAFDPDAFIVDKVPRGALGELEPTLASLRQRSRCLCVLGLRDILDDPPTVAHEWRTMAGERAVLDYYQQVWVYGDPAVFDLACEYQFSSEVCSKIYYTGYLARPGITVDSRDSVRPPWANPAFKTILCTVGGGQDGAELARAFCQVEFPSGFQGVILTGPFMPEDAQEFLRHASASRPHLHVVPFVTEPDRYLAYADRIITMGGYNSTCEALRSGKPTLVVPRVKPRLEQAIRAERLRKLGLVDVLNPNDLSSATLAHWLGRDAKPSSCAEDLLDWNGLAHVRQYLDDLVISCPSQFRCHTRENRHYASR